MSPSRLVNRVVPLLSQAAFLAAALAAAQGLAGRMRIVPSSIGKFTPLDGSELGSVFLYFGLAHLLVLLVPLGSERRTPFLTPRRLAVECVAALAAVSLASSGLFLFTQIPFSPNFYAWIYALFGLGYGIAGGAALVFHRKGDPAVGATSEFGAAARLLRSPLIYPALLLILLPGLLAGLYKVEPDFANWVNKVRVGLNVRTGGFKLVQAFPGRTFDQPMILAFSPTRRDEFFVLTRPGRLLRYRCDPWNEETLVDITGEVGGVQAELGALSFALHPEFGSSGSPNSGFVFVWYTHLGDDRQFCRLARFDVRPATLPERNATRTLLMDLPRASTGMHNGGTTLFGPEGFLYISVGDYVMKDCSQQVDRYLAGGILRIDVDARGGAVSRPIERRPRGATTQNYFIPLDNPWTNHPGALEEFYAIGLRNPFRMWMDPLDRDLWLGDIGLNHFEEVTRVRKGDNGEWDFREGPMELGNPVPRRLLGRRVPPVLAYRQTALDRAVIGGLIYRGRRLGPLQGLYVFCDNNSGKFMSFDPKRPEATLQTLTVAPQYGQMGPTGLGVGSGSVGYSSGGSSWSSGSSGGSSWSSSSSSSSSFSGGGGSSGGGGASGSW